MSKRKTVSTIILILLLACLTEPAITNLTAKATSGNDAKADWPMYHLDRNHTGGSNLTITTPIVPIWNNTANGSIMSSPAVVGGLMFIGSNDRAVHVFNTADGSRLDTYNFTTQGAVESSPAVVDNMVFVGSDDNNVYAWKNQFGSTSLKWTYHTDGSVRSSPTVANGTVFVGSDDGYVYALNETTTNPAGNLIWKFRTACPVYSSPAFHDNRIFVSASDGRVYALNFTGRCEWFVDAKVSGSSPTVADRKVFVGATNGTIYALNENNGTTLWNNTTEGAIESCPAVGNGMVFVDSYDKKTYAFNETTGNQIWNKTTDGPIYSSPAFADGKVFVGSSDTKLYILNATDVTSPLQDPLATSGVIYSSPAIAEDLQNRSCLYIGSSDQIYAFTTQNTVPQVAMSSFPAQPYILQTINFSGRASQGIANLTWNFGDGTPILPSSNPKDLNTTHAYAAAGTYNVTLAVTDNYTNPIQRQTNMTWQLVSVSEAWPMYRHDWSHTGYSTSFAPTTNLSLWSAKIGPTVTDLSLIYPSPAVVNGTVYASSTNGTVFAINTANGATIWNWSTPNSAEIHSSPAFADGMIFIGAYDGELYALNANGRTNWTSSSITGAVVSSPVIANNMVIIGSVNSWFYAFDKNTGHQNWVVGPGNGTGSSIYSSPAVADGMVFISSLDRNVYAFNSTNGTQIWKTKAPLSDKIASSPAVANGSIFIGTDNGAVYCLNEANGNVTWINSTGGRVASSAAVDGEKLFIGSDDGNVYAFCTNGTELWNQPIGPAGWASPAVGSDTVFIGSRNGTIYALDENGTVEWSFQTGAAVDSSPAILNGTLYVASKNGTLYALYTPIHDAAIMNVAASPQFVPVNQTVTITASLQNLGTCDENNVNVSAQYDGSLFYNNSFNVAQGGVQPLQFTWDTTNVSLGSYIICVNATLAAGEVDSNVTNNYGTCSVMVTSGGRDIAITNVALVPLKQVVCQSYTCNVTVTVENHGGYGETFNVTAYANMTAYLNNTATANLTSIDTINAYVATNNSTNLTIVWNTTGFDKGNYTISAFAWPVPGETNTADNNFTGGWVDVTMVGDLTGGDTSNPSFPWNFVPDGKCDGKDIGVVAKCYGSKPGSVPPEKWNANCDVNNDGKVDGKDIAIVARHYGERDP
jgi:outer membrane protein assembly factor BamB